MSTHRRRGSLRSSACPVVSAMRDQSIRGMDERTMTDVSCQKNGRGFGERRFCNPSNISRRLRVHRTLHIRGTPETYRESLHKPVSSHNGRSARDVRTFRDVLDVVRLVAIARNVLRHTDARGERRLQDVHLHRASNRRWPRGNTSQKSRKGTR